MDMKYVIGIIVVLIIIVGAFMVFGGSGQQNINVVGSTSVQPVAEELSQAYMKNNTKVKITVQGGGSAVGIKSVQDGTAQIGTSSKSLKANESQGLTQYEIAKDGIAVVVNNNNPVNGLTTDQIKGIFTGNITNWNQVGGSNAKINVIVREEGSGTRDAFQEIVLGKDASGKKVSYIKTATVQSSTEAIQQTVLQDPNAIGFISFASVKGTKSLTVDGVAVSESTVLDGSYKIQRPFIFLVKGEPKGDVKTFIDWVIGPEGKSIIKAEKLVPTGVKVTS